MSDLALEVGVFEPVLEFYPHALPSLGHVQERLVEPAPRYGEDDFMRPLAIGLQRAAPIPLMDPTATHRYQCALDLVEHAGEFERMDPAVGQCEIDRPAGLLGTLSRVGPALVKSHLHAAALQQDREQRAGRARADDGDGAAR